MTTQHVCAGCGKEHAMNVDNIIASLARQLRGELAGAEIDAALAAATTCGATFAQLVTHRAVYELHYTLLLDALDKAGATEAQNDRFDALMLDIENDIGKKVLAWMVAHSTPIAEEQINTKGGQA